jgi:O-antigen ligase
MASAPSRRPRTDTGRWLVAGVLVSGAFGVVLANVDSAVFDLERYQLPKALVLHAAALALLAREVVSSRRRAWSALEILVACFVAWSAVSGVLATNRWLALASWGVAFSGLIVLRAAGTVEDERWKDRAAGLVLAAIVLGALLGVAQAYGWDSTWLARGRTPGGTFGNRNFLAHLSAIAAPALLVLGLAPGLARRRALALIGLGIVVLAVVLTRSRAAWLATGLALAVATGGVLRVRSADRHARRAGLGWVAVVVAAAAVTAVGLPNALQWRDDSPYVGTLTRIADFREGSGRGRLIQYGNSLELITRHPVFGVGPGNWFVHYPTVTEDGDPAYGGHLSIPTNPWPSSDWVAMTVERGPLGALLLLGGGVWVLVTGLGRAGGGGRRGHRGAAAAGIVTATAVTGLFDAVLLLPAPTFLVAALLGLMLSGPPDGTEAHRIDEHGTRAGRRVALTGLMVAAALVSFTALHVRAVARTAGARDPGTLAHAARLAPWDHRLRLLLAEDGRCGDARAAARLMPHHPRPAELVAACDAAPVP